MLGASGRAFSKRTVFVKYLVTLSLFTLVIATYSLLMRYVLYAEAKDALISSQQARIEIFSVKLEKRADELLAMVQLLENNEYIQSYLQSPDEVKKSLIAKSWMDFFSYLKYIRSLRLVDPDGWEVIRVDYSATEMKAVLPAQFQFYGTNKSGSPEGGNAKISVEQGLQEEFLVVVKPYRWLWNFVIPLVKSDRHYQLILSISSEDFLARVHEGIQGLDAVQISNSDGFYIYGPNKSMLFGNELPERAEYNIPQQQPGLWQAMQQSMEGVAGIDGVSYVFSQINTFSDSFGAKRAYAVLAVDEALVAEYASTRMSQLFKGVRIMLVIVMLLSIPIAWAWARFALLREIQMLSDAAFRSTSPMLITDADEIILDVNPSFIQEFGFTEEELIGSTPRLLQSGEQDASFYQAMKEGLATDGHWDGEIINKRKDGGLVTEFLHIDAIKIDKSANPNFYVASYRDISLLKRMEDKLRKLTVTDPMTGTFNRRHFEHELLRHWDYFRRYPESLFSLAILDIDFFKNVNDKHGHDVGDQVIKRFSTLIERSLRKVDLLARIGGEEFAVILPQTSAEGAKTLLERIRKTVEDSTFEPRITCSIGVAESRLKADDLLFKCADKALYDAKESGRNRVCVYVYE